MKPAKKATKKAPKKCVKKPAKKLTADFGPPPDGSQGSSGQ